VRQALLPPPRLPSIPATPNQDIPHRSRANSTITGYQLITSANGQSDHRPVIAEFDLTRAAAHNVRARPPLTGADVTTLPRAVV
jgi:hypothetical protein